MAINTSKEKALLTLMEQTGYEICQENGQRKFGPPPDWTGPPPKKGSEVFIGKIPRDCYEDELVPLFSQIGKIYELRLMMDFSGCNRGYAFLMYTNPNDAKKAVQKLNNFEIRPGKSIGVVKSLDNCRLFVGKLPRDRSREEIIEEMKNVTDGVVNAIVHCYSQSRAKNRGYAFVEYENHRAAAMARRKLLPGKIKLWGTCDIQVDWAEPEPEVDEEIMSKVRILYVRNLLPDISEDDIRDFFSLNGKLMVEHVKKIKDYAFVHYKTRGEAEEALATLQNRDCSIMSCESANLEITWAKPSDQKKARKRNQLRIRNNVSGSPLDPFAINQGYPGVPPPPLPPAFYGGFGDGPVYDYSNHLAAAAAANSQFNAGAPTGMDISQLRLDGGPKLGLPWPKQADLMKSRDRNNNNLIINGNNGSTTNLNHHHHHAGNFNGNGNNNPLSGKPRIMNSAAAAAAAHHYLNQTQYPPQYPTYSAHPFGDGSIFGLAAPPPPPPPPNPSQYPMLFQK